jgi:uncharacterized protein YdhG (YjbR/CyaY superfamily)
MAIPVSVDAYIDALPPERKAVVEALRQTIRAAAPDASESIAYAMPAFRTPDGQFLVSYAAYRNHYSLFPASGAVLEALGDEIRPFFAGKGTFQFPASRPVPMGLVSKVIAVRLTEIKARAPRTSGR